MNKEILHRSISLLASREHSEKELVDKLKLKKYQFDEISPVVAYLQENNYQCDSRFAESYCRTRVNKGYGWQYIKQALVQKGVSHAIIADIKLNDDTDWYQQAELVYEKKFGYREIADQKDKAKRVRFLQSRGFSTDQIMTVINRSV